jgi:nitrite reductase/ring-hydroxylating ferredoxin subunit
MTCVSALPFIVLANAVVQASAWTRVATKKEVQDAGGKLVVETSAGRVLLAVDGDKIRACSNKCSHLGLPLVGKTALFQAEISDGCVTCPAHGTKFDLATGEVKGEWCPKMVSMKRIHWGMYWFHLCSACTFIVIVFSPKLLRKSSNDWFPAEFASCGQDWRRQAGAFANV